MVVFTFRLRFLSCSFTISAEIWSLNGKTTQTVSSLSFDGDKGRCWSQGSEPKSKHHHPACVCQLELNVKEAKRPIVNEQCVPM